MICEKCPAALLCLGGQGRRGTVKRCTRCAAIIFADERSQPNGTIMTVRCVTYGQRHPLEAPPEYWDVHGIDRWANCPRCNPLHWEIMATLYAHVFHYHHGRDGSVLEFTHLKWGKRQDWWLYRDVDEPPAGFAMPRPRDAP